MVYLPRSKNNICQRNKFNAVKLRLQLRRKSESLFVITLVSTTASISYFDYVVNYAFMLHPVADLGGGGRPLLRDSTPADRKGLIFVLFEVSIFG